MVVIVAVVEEKNWRFGFFFFLFSPCCGLLVVVVVAVVEEKDWRFRFFFIVIYLFPLLWTGGGGGCGC